MDEIQWCLNNDQRNFSTLDLSESEKYSMELQLLKGLKGIAANRDPYVVGSWNSCICETCHEANSDVIPY